MNKISIIIQREYLARVRKRSFIVMTILIPLLIGGVMAIPFWMSGMIHSQTKNIVVIDHVGKYEPVFQSNETYKFHFLNPDIQAEEENEDCYAFIVISDDLLRNPNGVSIYSDKPVNPEMKTYIATLLSAFVEEEKLKQYDIPNLKEIIENSKTQINIATVKWSDGGEGTENSYEIASIIGLIATFLIYFFIFTYGSQVMRGVVEEKTNRIVEVIISSVKPGELMIGKIIGIALVGLTQFFIWLVLIFILAFAAKYFYPIPFSEITTSFNFDIIKILGFFMLYFLGGYLLYASIFAAIGAASDNDTDTQQFMIPVTIPVTFALFAAVYSVSNPDSSFAFWCSVIPFTSPIVMMVRIPLGVPAWELILSISILISSFILTTQLAAKIYRTGILMRGKKVGWKELWKWVREK